jgi:regulator of replication initiation timing
LNLEVENMKERVGEEYLKHTDPKKQQPGKNEFIEQQASKGNVLAKQYLQKLRKGGVSIDWTHRVLINNNQHNWLSYS